MLNFRKVKFAALAGASFFVGVGQAHAQDTAAAPAAQPFFAGDITVGATDLTQSSPYYGRYNGQPQAGPGGLASWNLHFNDAWNSGGTTYFNFTGDNVSVGNGYVGPEAALQASVGNQGSWNVTASYNAMTYTQVDGFTTILDKSGNLSAGYQNALAGANMFFTNTSTNPSTLFGAFNASTHLATANPITTFGQSNELTMKTGTERQKGAVEGDYRLGSWVLSSSVSHEHKEGTLENTMTTGGNNAGMVAFPMPVDYNTDVFTAAAAYESDNLQAKLSYRFSSFNEGDPGGYQFEGWNFSAYNNPTAKTFTSYAKNGDYSTPPSSIAHDFRGEVGYNFGPSTRVMATAAYGLQMQNAAFVPATELGYITTNPAGASLAAQLASNPGSLDGLVETFFGNVVFTSSPLPKLNLKGVYSVDARTPDTKSLSIYGDPTDTTALKFRQAVPEGWVKQKFAMEAGYYVLPETKVTASFQFQNDQRTNAITALAQDIQETLAVHSTLTDTITGSADYSHAVRSASAPNFNFWLNEIQADCGSTISALGCQQVPFYEAARVEDTLNGRASAVLSEAASLSLFGKYDANNYHVPALAYNGILNPSAGLQQMSNIQGGPDLNYVFSQNAEVHFYYTFLRYTRDLRNLNANNIAGGNNYYMSNSTYDIHSAGVGATWHVLDNLKLVGDYLFSYGGETFVQTGNWDTGFPGDPLLNTRSVNNQVKLHMDYAYSPTAEYYLGYEFDSLDTADWELIGATVGQVLTGNLPPKYNVSKFTAAMKIKL